MQIAWRLIGYLRRYWLACGAAYTCLLVVTGVELFIPSLLRRGIDCGMKASGAAEKLANGCPADTDPLTVVGGAALAIVGLTLVKGAFQFGQGYLGEYGAQRVAYDLRNEIYSHLQKLSFSWHDRSQTGALMARATSDVEQLRNFTGRAFLQMAQFALVSIGVTVVLFVTNWQLAIVSLLTLPLLYRSAANFVRTVRPYFYQAQEELSVLASIVQENLAGAKVVKAFAREPDEIRKFDEQNELLLKQYMLAARAQAFANPQLDVLAQIGTVMVLLLGGYFVIVGTLSIGELVAFNTYLLLLVRPVRRLGFTIGQSSRAIAAGERIFEILDAPVDVEDQADAKPLSQITGTVTFDHVTCSYYGGEAVLKDVSFEAHPGQVVALLGATGSGKTTVVNLIPRFYDVSQGSVRIDGHDVRDVQLLSLRRQIGIVLQDTTLFTGTIRENIAFGVPDATDEHVFAMAHAARAHEFIMEFPDGYATRVGERGVTLSGGQKQRIAIARALLLDPRILILDDFTSAVDTETEALIREALNVLMEGRTTLVIAQRVSTVQSADQIIVLDHGEIVGVGSHEELLETNDIYAEIYQLQLMDESAVHATSEKTTTELVGANGNGGGNRWTDAPQRHGPNGNGVARPDLAAQAVRRAD
ncbi:MAG: putative transporter [Chloroflexi bacterium]|nr:putative transporter [Chloroflexota bacterium]